MKSLFRPRRKDGEEPSIDLQIPTRSKTSASVSTASGTDSSINDDGTRDTKGPLGLNLLYSPSDPLVDIIFVHGLGGGSRKTWSKTESLTHFWPQEWLPKEPALKAARIQSFGYNSDWAKGKDNCWNIHHFGKSLLGEISLSPWLAASRTPIMLVGHSMGGLVIKKAYMLARQSSVFEELSKRFRTIFFVATPHWGSDSAKLLHDILKFAYSSRAYVADLMRGSAAIQIISDEFQQYSGDLNLWSFYETQKLSMGVLSKVIVDPDLAVLGYEKEKQIPMNADHRSICKFDNSADPNYRTLRNAFVSAIEDLNDSVSDKDPAESQTQLRILRNFLGVSTSLHDDLTNVEDARVSGTCEWLTSKKTYLAWSDFKTKSPRILWVYGKPATGKSVLSGYVVEQIRRQNGKCSHFFFNYGDRTKSTLGACLRSLAFQMISANAPAREAMMNLVNNTGLDVESDRALWRELFVSNIFQVEMTPHYWIIDGLDECVDVIPFFNLVLAKIDASVPLRILITSRETPDIDIQFSKLRAEDFIPELISAADTLPDIRRLIEDKARHLALEDDKSRATLVENLVAKSEGSFLWTALVLNELSHAHGEEEINQILGEIPQDMELLYERTLNLMSQLPRGKKLAKAILAWTICAARPLTIKELDTALMLDMEDTFPKLEDSVRTLCGQLVTIDKFGRVQVIHQTAREFLLKEDLESEFAVSSTTGHTRIAKACLLYLDGEEMKPPRVIRKGDTRSSVNKRSEFSRYAIRAFSYHLSKANPSAREVLSLVNQFFKSNVLSWIEALAISREMSYLIRTVKNLRKYIRSCNAQFSPLSPELQTLRGWTTDLIRVAAKFANALVTLPSAIYSLIPPLCPTESMLYNVGSPSRRLLMTGSCPTEWDDRLSCIGYEKVQTSAVCHGDDFLAVGLISGIITLYHAATCQEYKTLEHGEPVVLLQFKPRSDILVSCGMRMVQVWDVRNGRPTYQFQAPYRPIEMAFDGDLLVIASYRNFLASWNLEDKGAKLLDRPWNDSCGDQQSRPGRPPSAISLSFSHRILAVGYSGQPITIWDLESDTYYGSCGKKLADGETSTHPITALIINPNPNIPLLVASYLDGELVLIDPFQDEQLGSLRANCHTLAASPDGRLLAGGAGLGIIQVHEFDSLRLLYRVSSTTSHIKQLAFTKDSFHLSDVRGSQCNVWEPSMLLRSSIADDSSDGSAAFANLGPLPTTIRVSAIAIHPENKYLLCGKDNGEVSLYDLQTGNHIRTLYYHKTSVRFAMLWARPSVVMSIDSSNAIIMQAIEELCHGKYGGGKLIFQSRLESGSSITHIVGNEEVGKFVLSTQESDHLWSRKGIQEQERKYSVCEQRRKWYQHPKSKAHLIRLQASSVYVVTWKDWTETSRVSFDINIRDLQVKDVFTHRGKSNDDQILVELSEMSASSETRNLFLLDSACFSLNRDPVKYEESATTDQARENESNTVSDEEERRVEQPLLLSALTRYIAHVIGTEHASGRLIFLDKLSWVSSIDMASLLTQDRGSIPNLSYSRHFFLPYEWLAGTRRLVCALVQRSVILARNGSIVVVKNGFDFAQMVDIKI